MTEHDPLGAELFALRPREPSAELTQRIADQLATSLPERPKTRSRGMWSTALAVIAIAASIAAIVLWPANQPAIRPTEVNLQEFASSISPDVNSAFDDELPSVWAYRSALNRSPEALDALLDQHATRISEPNPERARDFVFARFETEQVALTGEL